jgi:hypothetical protein
VSKHLHTRTDELHVFFIPADTDCRMGMRVIGRGLSAMQKVVGGYIQEVNSPLLPELYCGCPMVIIADEEGKLKQKPHNLRASILLMGDHFVGDVFLVGQGLVGKKPDREVDYFSLPQILNEWEGPGNPLPPQRIEGLG